MVIMAMIILTKGRLKPQIYLIEDVEALMLLPPEVVTEIHGHHGGPSALRRELRRV
jgi:hypothetical protein